MAQQSTPSSRLGTRRRAAATPAQRVVGILAGQRVPDGHEPIVSRQKEVPPLQKGRPLRHGLHERRGMLGHAGLLKD
ncbi:MAG: hypothetical protein ACLSAH_13785 [Bilophila wadsworthia]